MARRTPVGTPPRLSSLVLDTGAILALARHDRRTHVFVTEARADGAEVFVSWLTLAELIPGSDSPAIAWALSLAQRHRVTEEDCEQAARLMAEQGVAGATVDAVIAAAALDLPRPLVVLTSDPKDMGALVAGQEDVAVLSV